MKTIENIKTLLRAAVVAELKARQEDIDINIEGSVADIDTGRAKFSVWLECRKIKKADLICISAEKQEQIKSAKCKYLLIHSERAKTGYWAEIGRQMNFSVWERHAVDENNEDALIYELIHPYSAEQ